MSQCGRPSNDFALGEGAWSWYDMTSDISRLMPQGHNRATALRGMCALVSHQWVGLITAYVSAVQS